MQTAIVLIDNSDYQFVLNIDNVLTMTDDVQVRGFFNAPPLTLYQNPNWCCWLIAVPKDGYPGLVHELARVGGQREIRLALLNSDYEVIIKGMRAIAGWKLDGQS